MKYLVNLDLSQNELQNAKIQNLATAPSTPVAGQIYFNTASNKYFGYNGTKWVDLGYEHPSTHTIAQISGLQSALDGKAAVNHNHDNAYKPASYVPAWSEVTGKPSTFTPASHTHNEYVNQNAFSNVKVGTTTVAADSTTDTLEFVAGSNIVLTPDATTDKITIAVNGETVSASDKSNWNAKETTSGSQAKADKALADAKAYANQKVADLVGSAPEALDTLQELADAVQGNQAGVTDLLQKVGTKAEKSYVDSELAKKANSSHTHTGAQVNLTGYAKPSATGALAASDTLNAALGKLEKALDGKQAAGSYAAASHNHDSAYLGKTATAAAATKLATARTINGVAFDGTANITVSDSTKVAPTGTIVANRIAVFNDTTGKVIKDSGFTIATSVPANAKFTDTVYTHPANHPASIITQDANNRFVTDAEKSAWNGKAAGNHNHNGTYTRKYAANIGDGTNSTIKVTHNLGTEDVTVTVREVSTKQVVMADIQIYDSNSINILFASAPASGTYRVVVTG